MCSHQANMTHAAVSFSFSCVFTHDLLTLLQHTLHDIFLEKGITEAWRSPNGGGNSKMGWVLQNRAWLPPIDRQAHDTHAQFFLPINFSANFAPQMILKILLVVSITVLISYTRDRQLRSWRAGVLQSLAPTLIKHTCL